MVSVVLLLANDERLIDLLVAALVIVLVGLVALLLGPLNVTTLCNPVLVVTRKGVILVEAHAL